MTDDDLVLDGQTVSKRPQFPVEFNTTGVVFAAFQMAAAAFVAAIGSVGAATLVALLGAYILGVATSASTTAQDGDGR